MHSFKNPNTAPNTFTNKLLNKFLFVAFSPKNSIFTLHGVALHWFALHCMTLTEASNASNKQTARPCQTVSNSVKQCQSVSNNAKQQRKTTSASGDISRRPSCKAKQRICLFHTDWRCLSLHDSVGSEFYCSICSSLHDVVRPCSTLFDLALV